MYRFVNYLKKAGGAKLSEGSESRTIQDFPIGRDNRKR